MLTDAELHDILPLYSKAYFYQECILRDIFDLANWGIMRQPKRLVVTPVWAQQIEVERQGNTLLVTGWGRIPDPFDAKEIASESIAKMDIFRRFRRYVLRHLSEKKTTEDAGVYQFADADTDEKLISFVKEFGPVWGEVRSTKYEDNGTMTISVAQSMKLLRYHQEEFAAATRLLQLINQKRNTHTAEDCADVFTAIGRMHIPAFAQIVLDNFLLTEGSICQKAASILPWAHRALCMVLNEHHPKLIPFDDRAIELPVVQDEGIRDAIYWQLRQDYLAQRAIGTCLHCGGHFPIRRRGAQGCSGSCSRALRNEKYWNENKDSINRDRQGKRAGRK